MFLNRPQEIIDELYADSLKKNPNREGDIERAFDHWISIIVSYDMGWSKRGNGKSYDSLNGYGAIIGFLSGKVLDYATRNRKCRMCDNGHPTSDHDCRKNYVGSAKSMESDAGTDLIVNSKILKDNNVRARVFIGDEDAKTAKEVQEKSALKMFKLCDQNHLNKNFSKDLYKLQATYKELAKKGVIKHLKKLFSYAIAANKKESSDIARALQNIPDHVYGKHENCGNWCSSNPNAADSRKKKCHTITLKNPELYKKLQDMFSNYAGNARKFSISASSQRNETLNGLVTRFAPKNKSYSTSESADFRVSLAVLHFNEGSACILQIKELLKLDPGEHTEKFAKVKDAKRVKKSEKNKVLTTKARRNVLKQNRENLRKNLERKEGPTYQSNLGISGSASVGEQVAPVDISALAQQPGENLIPVYYDLETGGLEEDADLLQIAAKGGGKDFSVYITPTKNVNKDSSAVTGITNIGPNLYVHGKTVTTLPLQEALYSFHQFLRGLKKNCVLIAHNGNRFDHPRLLRAIHIHSMTYSYSQVLYGFCDTLPIFRKNCPDRKGPGMFKLGKLASDYLEPCEGSLHNAIFDVEMLQKLCNKLIQRPDTFIKNSLTFKESVQNEANKSLIKTKLPELKNIQKISSLGVCKRLIQNQMTSTDLQDMYDQKGEEYLQKYLAEKINRKARVTSNKKYLENICKYLSNTNA